MASRPPKIISLQTAIPSPDGTDLWRRGASRLVEQGRLMWLLGEGLNAAFTKRAQGWAPPSEEELAIEIFGWMQQAWTSVPRGFQLKQSKSPPPTPARARKTSSGLPSRAMMKEGLSELQCPVLWVGSREIGGSGRPWHRLSGLMGYGGFSPLHLVPSASRGSLKNLQGTLLGEGSQRMADCLSSPRAAGRSIRP